MPDKVEPRGEVEIYHVLERGEVISQQSLAKRVSLSVGMVNALMRRAVRKGFVKVRAAPLRRYAYYLTPRGFAEKSQLVASYLESSLAFFRTARDEYLDLITAAATRSGEDVVFVGSGELVEIALLAAQEADVNVIGVFDPGANASRICGLPVLRSLGEDPAASAILVVTASRHPQQAFDQVRQEYPDREVHAPPFLRVSMMAPALRARLRSEVG